MITFEVEKHIEKEIVAKAIFCVLENRQFSIAHSGNKLIAHATRGLSLLVCAGCLAVPLER